MKRAVLILMTLFLSVGLVYGKDYEVTKKAGDLTVQIKIDRNPPIAGQNKMEVGIQDVKGKAVTDAVVAVEYIMPAMPGMPAMNYKAKTVLKGVRYLATLDFSMSGPWTVNIKILRGGKTQAVKINVDVK